MTDHEANLIQKPDVEIPEKLSILPLRSHVVFPFMIIPLSVDRRKHIRLVERSLQGNRLVGLITQRDPEMENPRREDLFDIGVVGMIVRKLVMPDDSARVIIQGVSRFRLKEIVRERPFLVGDVEPVKEVAVDDTETKALVQNILNLFQKLVDLSEHLPNELYVMALNLEEPTKLADFIVSNLNLKVAEKQGLLETLDLKARLNQLTFHLNNEIMMVELGSQIQSKAMVEIRDSQKEFFLRQQLKTIQRELGELDERSVEDKEYRDKIAKAGMPQDIQEAAFREVERLKQIPQAVAEYSVVRTYLDWLVDLPWSATTPDNLDLDHAALVLDHDHFGLEKVKERILEYLAVLKLKNTLKGPILCLVGPPGVGKTSLGRSIAQAMGRKFHRVSLGGIRDEAEIRGHRRTYVGAMPGRIIQGMRKAGTANPVFLLDEIDKLGLDFRGDPTSALLEVLDPEQNFAFSDHYLEQPFDLSRVLFITTANLLDPIPDALRDRLEVLRLPGYVAEEKLQIAKKHLIPKLIKEHGLKRGNLSIKDPAVSAIIAHYTREAGVRQLEREIATVCRKVATRVVRGGTGKNTLLAANLSEFLGAPKFTRDGAGKQPEVGVATGLAWTAAGGEILFIEVQMIKGKKSLTITGQLGEVMKESCQAALSCLRAQAEALGADPQFYEDHDLHIHVPEGATPKDGPSAGVAIFSALASVVTQRTVRHDLAMTGEITLRGKVLPVGGIKEKVLAARRAGIPQVLLPEENRKDFDEIEPYLRKGLEATFVSTVQEVLNLALAPEKKKK